MNATVDRAALVRRALLEVVAEQGFHGTSMAAVASRAGVATGTAYVHYSSKDDLVLATYREVKEALGAAAVAGDEPAAAPETRFRRMWLQVFRHLADDPDRAHFLLQVEASPYGRITHEVIAIEDDILVAVASDLAPLLIDVPLEILYELGFGPALRLAAQGERVDDEVLERVADACWRSVTK